MHLDAELVDRGPVLDVAIEPVCFLDEEGADARVPSELAEHLAERRPTCLTGGLHIDEIAHDHQAIDCGVVFQQFDLSGDGISFPLLIAC